jgi:hypothetical protein
MFIHHLIHISAPFILIPPHMCHYKEFQRGIHLVSRILRQYPIPDAYLIFTTLPFLNSLYNQTAN